MTQLRLARGAPTFLHVGINRKRTDVDEAPQAFVLHSSFQKIPRRCHRVQERIGAECKIQGGFYK
jgi:hypothetical protein